MDSQSQTRLSDWTELNWIDTNKKVKSPFWICRIISLNTSLLIQKILAAYWLYVRLCSSHWDILISQVVYPLCSIYSKDSGRLIFFSNCVKYVNRAGKKKSFNGQFSFSNSRLNEVHYFLEQIFIEYLLCPSHPTRYLVIHQWTKDPCLLGAEYLGT